MNPLPQAKFLKLRDIIGDPKANPPVPAIIPVCKATWYAGQKGPNPRFPSPVRIGDGRGTFYRSEDIHAILASN